MKAVITLLSALIFFASISSAQELRGDAQPVATAPSTLYYQGYATIASGSVLPSGSYAVTFALYTAAGGGTALWQETHPAVQVKNGLFSALLGQGSPAQPLALPFDQQYYLGIKIGTNPEFAPRIALSSSAYSFRARTADDAASVDWNAIRNVPAGFADGIDNTGGSGSAGVSTLNGKSGDVTLTAGSNVSIDASNPSSLVINASGGSGDMLKAMYDPNGNGKVEGAEFAETVPDASITMSKLADNAVTKSKIADGSIVDTKISDDAVTQSKIQDGSIKEPKLADGSVALAKIQASNPVAGKVLGTDGSKLLWQDAGGGGLSLPYSGSYGGSMAPAAFAVSTEKIAAITGRTSANGPNAIEGITSSNSDAGVVGRNYTGHTYGSLGSKNFGAYGTDTTGGCFGALGSNHPGYGFTYAGVLGVANSSTAIRAYATNQAIGVATSSQGSGSALQAENLGSGKAGFFVNWEPTNTMPSIWSSSAGCSAGYFESNGSITTFPTLEVLRANPGGSAGSFTINNAGNAAHAIYATTNGTGKAGYFAGGVHITGTLSKGSGTFMIDHPLDPENKYLYHSFVESPDMMNVYNGNAVLDGSGEAWIDLPSYFEALNGDYRYQLTSIGAPGPNLYVAQEVQGNRFKVAGGQPGAKVSWQVTGVRQDRFAQKHRVIPEVDKAANERGTYLHAKEWEQPASKSIDYQPVREKLTGQEGTGGTR